MWHLLLAQCEHDHVNVPSVNKNLMIEPICPNKTIFKFLINLQMTKATIHYFPCLKCKSDEIILKKSNHQGLFIEQRACSN